MDSPRVLRNPRSKKSQTNKGGVYPVRVYVRL